MRNIFVALFVLVLGFVQSAEARDLQFGFHEQPPKVGLSKEIQFLYALKPIGNFEIEATVDLPNLPIIRNFRMGYVAYVGSVPAEWRALTLEWSTADNCSLEHVHVAVGAPYRHNLDTLYNELFSLGFRQAVEKLGVDTCDERKGGRSLRFSFAEEEWTFIQLSEAVSEVGTIRAAVQLNRPGIIRFRFNDVMKTEISNYALTRFLVRRSGADPKKYEAELGLAIQSFLDRHQKKR